MFRFPAVPRLRRWRERFRRKINTLYVAADGTGDFYSIQRALDAAPEGRSTGAGRAPGTYREVLTIDKPNIQFRSANPDASQDSRGQ